MNPTNKTEVDNFFRTWNKIEKQMETREHIETVKKEITFYVNHEITDTELIVSWVMGNKIEMGDKFFKLEKFLKWCEDNCQDRKLWTKQVQNHFEQDDWLTETVFDIENYIAKNEEMLVKEYFNLNK